MVSSGHFALLSVVSALFKVGLPVESADYTLHLAGGECPVGEGIFLYGYFYFYQQDSGDNGRICTPEEVAAALAGGYSTACGNYSFVFLGILQKITCSCQRYVLRSGDTGGYCVGHSEHLCKEAQDMGCFGVCDAGIICPADDTGVKDCFCFLQPYSESFFDQCGGVRGYLSAGLWVEMGSRESGGFRVVFLTRNPALFYCLGYNPRRILR